MTFKDMIKAKNVAVATEKKAEAERAETYAAAQAAIARTSTAHDQAVENTRASHQAIRDLLADRGEHFLVDDDGTLTVFKLAEVEIGYIAVQPIPGTNPTTMEIA